MKSLGSQLFFASLLAALTSAGCGSSEYVIVGSPQAVGADAVASVEEIEGGNLLINVEARNLAPAGRLQPGASKFVMWVIPAGKPAHNAGALEYDEDDREGHGVATTPVKSFELRVTAEASKDAATPGPTTVFTKQIRED